MATIKKGTYRWIDKPPIPNFELAGDVIAFPIISNGNSFSYMSIENNLTDMLIAFSNDITFTEATIVYSTNGFISYAGFVGWNVNYQFFTVSDDFDVDNEDFANWFSYSTIYEPMLIKAGEYRWNDVLTTDLDGMVDGFLLVPIKFITNTWFEIDHTNETVSEITPYEQSFSYIVAILDDLSNPSSLILGYNISSDIGEDINDRFGYIYGWSWNGLAELLKVQQISNYSITNGWGQTITITEDQYVPTTFGLWANENWQKLGEETTIPVVEITYKDKVITLKAGQTARLHNADGSSFGFEEDLVIKANKVETVSEWDGSFSKSKLIRIFVTGLADGVPHEEFVLSGTWRSFLEYCASVNWTTFTSEDYDGTTFVKYNGYFLNKSVGGVPALVPISDSIVEDYEYTYNNM